jgi:hypothetical protein
MNKLPHSKNEDKLITYQNTIKKYLNCVAVYDLPVGSPFIPEGFLPDITGTSSSIFVSKYNKNPKLSEYKLYFFNEK